MQCVVKFYLLDLAHGLYWIILDIAVSIVH